MHRALRRTLLPLTTSALIVAGLPAVANAAPDPTTGVELVVDQERFVGETARFNPAAGRTDGLRALKQLRSEIWDKNPYFKGYGFEGYTGRLRDAAAKEGIVTKEQYLNVQVDADLNWIAIQRAVEVSEVFAHVRPDGSKVNTATRNGQSPSLDSLAAGTNSTMYSAIYSQLGMGELQALNNLEGAWGEDKMTGKHDGHLIHLIHPRHTVWGFGGVNVTGSAFGNYFVAVNGDRLRSVDNAPSADRTVRIYRAAKNGENPTGVTNPSTPNPGDNTTNPGTSAPDASGSLNGSNVGTIIGIIVAILSILGGLGWAITGGIRL